MDFYFIDFETAFELLPRLTLGRSSCPCCDAGPVWHVEIAWLCWGAGVNIQSDNGEGGHSA